MGIQYSGNATIFDIVTGPSTPSQDFINGLVSGLVGAGWTNTAVPASDVLTFTGQPANSSTVTLDSAGRAITYTFVTSFSNTAFNVLIGLSVAATISNLSAAINGGAGGGSVYGNGTGYVPHTTMTSTPASSALTVDYKTGGGEGNGAPVSTGGTVNATWASGTLSGGGNQLLSAITPQGLQIRVNASTAAGGFYTPGTTGSLTAGSRDGARVGPDFLDGVVGTSTTFKCIANKYQFFTLLPGSTSATIIGAGSSAGCPFIPPSLTAPTIVTATNANPISCNIPSHGFTSGQQVFIVGGLGNTNVNGTYTITVVDANNFTLNGSTGNGTYVSNSAFCSNLTQSTTIVEALWSTGNSNASPVTFRQGFNPRGATTYQLVNKQGSSNAGASSAPVVFWPNNAVEWYDSSFLLYDPLMGWSPSGTGGQSILGQMWDAVAVHNSTPGIDQTATFDTPSHNFWVYSVDSGAPNSSLFLATS